MQAELVFHDKNSFMSDEKYPPLVLRLIGTSETNWILEGTEKSNMPQRLSWPGLLRIPPTSKVMVPDAGGGFHYEQIRHIAGCDYIDPVRQDKENFKPNLEQDNIWIPNGTITIQHVGADIGKWEYLKKYEGNTSNPNRPPEAEDIFEEVVAVDISRTINVNFDKKADAYAILREIRQPNPDGSDGYVYNTDKLALVSTLFDLNHLDTPDEKFSELFRIADTKPELIVDSIANGKKKLLAAIKRAEELSVIGFMPERVIFSESKTVILPFKGNVSKANQVNRLADFLLTEEGTAHLQQLHFLVEKALNKTLEPVH